MGNNHVSTSSFQSCSPSSSFIPPIPSCLFNHHSSHGRRRHWSSTKHWFRRRIHQAREIHLRFKDTPNLGLLSFKLDASFLFSSDLREGPMRDWSALLRLRSVGMGSKLDRAHDTSLGGEDISSLVHVVVTTESTLGSIGGVVNLNSDSLTLVDKSDLRGVDHNCVVIGPLSSDPLKN